MSENDKVPEREVRTVPIRVIDLIDFYISCKELGGKAEEMGEFILDLFPEDMTDDDFTDYWTEYSLALEEQRAELEEQALHLKVILFEEGKWGKSNR